MFGDDVLRRFRNQADTDDYLMRQFQIQNAMLNASEELRHQTQGFDQLRNVADQHRYHGDLTPDHHRSLSSQPELSSHHYHDTHHHDTGSYHDASPSWASDTSSSSFDTGGGYSDSGSGGGFGD